jgi:hypothetical protein
VLLWYPQGGDAVSTGRILETVVELCFQLNDQKALRENITLMSKRRGQLKAATKKMVKKAMTFLDQLDYDNKMALLDVLMKVTEGRVRFLCLASASFARYHERMCPDVVYDGACRSEDLC